MALLDRMKQQAQQVAQKAQEAGRAGQAKLEDAQARRQLDALYRSLGEAAYAVHVGRGDQAAVDRFYGEIAQWEKDHEGTATASTADDGPGDESTPEGGYKL